MMLPQELTSLWIIPWKISSIRPEIDERVPNRGAGFQAARRDCLAGPREVARAIRGITGECVHDRHHLDAVLPQALEIHPVEERHGQIDAAVLPARRNHRCPGHHIGIQRALTEEDRHGFVEEPPLPIHGDQSSSQSPSAARDSSTLAITSLSTLTPESCILRKRSIPLRCNPISACAAMINVHVRTLGSGISLAFAVEVDKCAANDVIAIPLATIQAWRSLPVARSLVEEHAPRIARKVTNVVWLHALEIRPAEEIPYNGTLVVTVDTCSSFSFVCSVPTH
ncbi:hypothetical protein SELMODRAFT_411771 [Selaginella moellendorffii]|uniref:Uncharacterized protein n=1 Tax=Selaginella moellendorffii TaxID=88036 RepID=D8RIZ9_SELML|nr:hypothetical protein SELMODRAFT_411771 [Selaginella moellendorffii]